MISGVLTLPGKPWGHEDPGEGENLGMGHEENTEKRQKDQREKRLHMLIQNISICTENQLPNGEGKEMYPCSKLHVDLNQIILFYFPL